MTNKKNVQSTKSYFLTTNKENVSVDDLGWEEDIIKPSDKDSRVWAYEEITYSDGEIEKSNPAMLSLYNELESDSSEVGEEKQETPEEDSPGAMIYYLEDEEDEEELTQDELALEAKRKDEELADLVDSYFINHNDSIYDAIEEIEDEDILEIDFAKDEIRSKSAPAVEEDKENEVEMVPAGQFSYIEEIIYTHAISKIIQNLRTESNEMYEGIINTQNIIGAQVYSEMKVTIADQISHTYKTEIAEYSAYMDDLSLLASAPDKIKQTVDKYVKTTMQDILGFFDKVSLTDYTEQQKDLETMQDQLNKLTKRIKVLEKTNKRK